VPGIVISLYAKASDFDFSVPPRPPLILSLHHGAWAGVEAAGVRNRRRRRNEAPPHSLLQA
jgi:hypothetical protein